ncbi:hypothetical protein LJB42_002745 [Komagataella kurtzmanii]|nr:hypothetical protein LJB42_002745 [Komagataella kurtzmanii]
MTAYTDVVNDLSRELSLKKPKDVIQFCADYFNNKLAEDPARQQPSTATAPSSRPAQTASGAPLFQDQFGGDPHEPLSHHPHRGSIFKDSFTHPEDPQSNKIRPLDNASPGSGFAAHLAKVNFNPERRISVSAESVNPEIFATSSWQPPVHDLSDEQLQRLNNIVRKSFLFSQLEDEALRTVIYALEEKKVPRGTEIIKQGDEGDYFYVLESGEVTFVVNGETKGQGKSGSTFGELALMYNSPRAATVISSQDCVLWALDRMTFRRILLEGTAKRRAMYDGFLKDVPVLRCLNSYERNKLADALESETYNKGDTIIREGEPGENFYFIEQGEAEVFKEGEGHMATLGKGDYFGELALLNDLPRQATVVAKSDVIKVVTLDKNGFQRLLGPAIEVLKLQDPTKI